ncbi:MAG: hypothetical protein Q7R70_02790 [Candidatus Diapherotrites archaeon]|nr:hypothetical protein [Candidatus Diapherotrites archaeon]
MSKPRNRDIYAKELNDLPLSFRTNKKNFVKLKELLGTTNTSKAINEAIKHYLSSKNTLESNYECDSCNKKILKQEPYYCNLDQLEIRTDDEIVVTKAEPVKIICLKCAKKDPKILEFIESEDNGKGDQVKESNRIE